MQNNQQSFGVLAGNLLSYLQRLNYQHRTIEAYRYRLRHLSKMLPNGDDSIYNHEAWEFIVSQLEENKTWTVIETYRRALLQTADAVFELHNTGTLEIHHRTRRNCKKPDVLLLPEIAEHLKTLEEKGYQAHTLYEYRTHLVKFQEYLASRHTNIAAITNSEIFGFINSLSGYSEPLRYRTICCFRVFLRYLHESSVLEMNYSILIPRMKIHTNEKIPSVYSADEIRQILASIKTASPAGKRDYAILMLIAKTGLRASDVSNLEFSNLDWERNTISITQFKTGKSIQLPLLADVGNAIVSYLKHGRPESQSPKVFLQARPRFEPLKAAAVSSIFQNMAQRGGILSKPGRKHGAHAFRHSLVSELLSKSVPFPIITQILGHTGSDTTLKNYARIDLSNLAKCSLSVPSIPVERTLFAIAKGGRR